jgi:ribosomal protein S18 acetylase RimI-like enzyme
MAPAFTVASAQPDELAPAFEMIFRQHPELERRSRVANALNLVRQGDLMPEGIWVARRGKVLIGALVCLPLVGASALVWPPQVLAGIDTREAEDLLMQRASDWMRGRGVKLAQALLTSEESQLASPLERNGFTHTTTLWYLRHHLHFNTASLPAEELLTYRAYPTASPEVFQQTLGRTYEGTLDCPEVNGVRTLEEVLAGHRASALHDPERWWLAFDGKKPVGVLLATASAETHGWDLAYVGVIPEARGRGVGRELVRKALFEARTADAECVTLSVDTRNRPAWKLYLALGFEPDDRREVYLAVWR